MSAALWNFPPATACHILLPTDFLFLILQPYSKENHHHRQASRQQKRLYDICNAPYWSHLPTLCYGSKVETLPMSGSATAAAPMSLQPITEGEEDGYTEAPVTMSYAEYIHHIEQGSGRAADSDDNHTSGIDDSSAATTASSFSSFTPINGVASGIAKSSSSLEEPSETVTAVPVNGK